MKILLILSAFIYGVSAFGARYVVVVKDPRALQFSKLERLIKNSDSQFEIKQSFPLLKTLVIESADEDLQALDSSLHIEKEVIHPLPKVQVSVPFGLFNIDTANPWGIEVVKAKRAWPLSKKGAGARVLILDSGIDASHPALKGQVELGKNLVSEEQPSNDIKDVVGHGTHVAGVIAGKEATNGFSGVAPAARLIIGKICAPDGCTSGDMIAGIEWGLKQKVDVINLSIGDEKKTEAERMAIAAVEKAGIVVVAATGNDGKEVVSYPAAYPTAIAVGSVNKDMKKSDFSQWGPELDIMAPGNGIVSSTPVDSGKPYSIYSGTSMATPHVTGVVALVKATKKSLSPAQVRNIIKATATALAGNSSQYGAGLVNAEKAVTKASELR